MRHLKQLFNLLLVSLQSVFPKWKFMIIRKVFTFELVALLFLTIFLLESTDEARFLIHLINIKINSVSYQI